MRLPFIPAILLALGLFASALPVAKQAQAQQGCGHSVVVTPGDTLASIARRCGTTITALIAANPGLNPNVIWPGLTIRIQSAGHVPQRDWRDNRPSGHYTVRPGDTLSSISREAGVSVAALLALNPHIDPRFLRIGEVLRLPGGYAPDRRREQVRISPTHGRPGTLVTVSGSGFERNARLLLMLGSTERSLREVDRVRADWRGRVETSVRIPDWATRRDTVVFALASPNARISAVSQPFRILGLGPERPGQIDLIGTLIRTGAECPTMRGDDGRTYSLVGELGRFRPGDRVRVEGRTVQMSICMQGTTVEVIRIRQAE